MDFVEEISSFLDFLNLQTILTFLLLLLPPLLLLHFRSSFYSSSLVPDVASSENFADSAAADDSLAPEEIYDVFISFRGADIRDSFLSHLYDALCQKNISAYIDDRLEKGGEINSNLLKAIEQSTISIVIFSENYATSSWCLDELVHIMKWKELVLPVFYRVDPSDVRRQKGSYQTGISKLARYYGKKKVEDWRNALTQAANLSGFHSKDIRPETELVKAIIQDVLQKMKQALSSSDLYLMGFVGLEKPIQQIESLLCIGSRDIQVIGLWGMPGIGKTTLAGLVFHKVSCHFESYCFIENVREKSENYGQNYVRNKLCVQLLGEENLNITTPFLNPFITTRLRRKKVLIVLDDVSHPRQLEFLGGQIQFGHGSRIIVTTRDKHVLTCIIANEMVIQLHEVKGLRWNDALHLLQFYAFRRNSPTQEYKALSTRVVSYAEGNPLALKTLGSHLCDRSMKIWESTLNKLEKIPDKDMHKVLRISYDDLDDNEKNIFLDLACFFKGENVNIVRNILDGSGFFSDVGFELLVEKSLITINSQNELRMHDLIQQMGREVVRQKSINSPEKRTRLWNAEEIYHVLQNDIGTGAIEGIYLNMSSLKKPLHLKATTFSKMYNLRLLIVYRSDQTSKEHKVHAPSDLQALPEMLRYLHWEECPWKSLPLDFPENIVALHLPNSQVEELWDEIKIPMRSLTYLNVSGCTSLNKFPQLPRCITNLDLSGTTIMAVPESIEGLSHLGSFELVDCKRLGTLPTNICKLKHLNNLSLRGCTELKTFDIVEPMENLQTLNLSETAIEELPSGIGYLGGLTTLSSYGCKQLATLPTSMKQLVNLCELILSDCVSLKSLPELPSSLSISAQGCTSLEMVPPLITTITDSWRLSVLRTEYFRFENCPKLDQNAHYNTMLGTLLRIYKAAYNFAAIYTDYKHSLNPQVRVVYPGNQFPEWIDARTEGNSLHIKLLPEYSFGQLLGIVGCAHVAVKKYFEDRAFLQWNYKCLTSNGWSGPFYGSHSLQGLHLDHVFILYDTEKSFFEFGNDISEIKLEVSIDEYTQDFPTHYEVKMCGIKCVYAEEAVEFLTNYQLDEEYLMEEGTD